uniref:Uncharacterized protein n=1 Tax=Panagrolaimus sp. JU765 TaxID=591449 RepID=A0AC34Q2D7_9BILA
MNNYLTNYGLENRKNPQIKSHRSFSRMQIEGSKSAGSVENTHTSRSVHLEPKKTIQKDKISKITYTRCGFMTSFAERLIVQLMNR